MTQLINDTAQARNDKQRADHDAEAGDRELYRAILGRSAKPEPTDAEDLRRLAEQWGLSDDDLQAELSAYQTLADFQIRTSRVTGLLADGDDVPALDRKLARAEQALEDAIAEHQGRVSVARAAVDDRLKLQDEADELTHGIAHLIRKHPRLREG